MYEIYLTYYRGNRDEGPDVIDVAATPLAQPRHWRRGGRFVSTGVQGEKGGQVGGVEQEQGDSAAATEAVRAPG